MSNVNDNMLGALIAPKQPPARRHMIGLAEEEFSQITELARRYDTSKRDIIIALLAFYNEHHQPEVRHEAL